MVKTSPSSARGVGLTPGRGAKIPHTQQKKKNPNIKQKQFCNRFNKDFKMVHIKKILKKNKTFLFFSLLHLIL